MQHLKYITIPLGLALAVGLAGCATNGNSTIPSTTQANLNSNVLQVAVGTANIGQDGVVGLNVVTTLRASNGSSGVLANLPTLTGPTGFLVPAGTPGAYSSRKYGANVDAGTNHISGSPQVPLNNAGLVNSTLGTFTGVFSYGFGPFNSDQKVVSGAYYPGNPNASGGNGFNVSNYDIVIGATQPLPFYSADAMEYLEGPPSVPFFNDGTFPVGFAGYSPGFTPFEVAPVAGTYNLSVLVPAANASPVTYKASANLSSTTPLGAIPTPTFTSDAKGGGTGAVTVPAGVTETMVFIADATTAHFYSVGPLTGTGTLSFTLPDTLGTCSGSGCQSGANATPSINAGDTYVVSAVGYDYPAFEAGPPGNTSQKPTIVGANGQADITMSPLLSATY